ncbi:MAG: NAD(P)-binding domain-containing protein [Actinomycetota bacterium]
MTQDVRVAVVGAGQAGLSTSHELTAAGVEPVGLDRGRVGQSWCGRWDSFCLVTPNWSTRLPGHPYDGDDPDGYLLRDELVAYFERYARSFDAPVQEGVDVRSVEPAGDGFAVRTSGGELRAEAVVVATGSYHRPHRPEGAAMLPTDLVQIDVTGYRNPSSLPDGAVLVVGGGQSGLQISEELLGAGRDVFLSCGKAPWVPRRLGGRDIVWWAIETGFLDQRVEDLPTPVARLGANLQNTGRAGGHDLSYRVLRAAGATLLGRFRGADGGRARFAPDLGETIAWGDARTNDFMDLVRTLVAERDLPMPDVPDLPPFDDAAPEHVELSRLGAVVFAGGFRPGYASLVRVPGAFDDLGFPIHVDGESAVAPGLHFVGVHFLRTRKSSLLCGVADDAALVAGRIAAGLR